ncbi:MAG TPA: neutral zinc metallopeptidase [Bauldia sp.]|nr:neutral zinc metallopeptidase [Bauldia sp.]
MEWQGRRESGNIEDRRGMGGGMGGLGGGGFRGGGFGGGGLSLGAIAVIVVLGLVLHVNPLDLLSSVENGTPLSTGDDTGGDGGTYGKVGTPTDQSAQFIATVLADTEDTWTNVFTQMGKRYTPPTLVLFSDSTGSACGGASEATGPFYCPLDKKVYLDLGFFQQLASEFQASGDFAQAYVVAHEIGHAVQDQLGILGKADAAREKMSDADSNKMSIRIELQADCFAGVWAHDEEKRGFLDVGDIDEALNAAAQVGDDAIQKREQGYVVPESFNHGTSEQRSRWFKRGYNGGTIDSCDTFTPSNV